MKYPEFKYRGTPTPATGMVCDNCNEFFWEMLVHGKVYRCQCGNKKRLATDVEKRKG